MMIICLEKSGAFGFVISPPYLGVNERSHSCDWTQTAGKYAVGIDLPRC